MTEQQMLLSEAMNFLDDAFIEEADDPDALVHTPRISERLKTILQFGLVACLCVVALAVARIPFTSKGRENAEADRDPSANFGEGEEQNGVVEWVSGEGDDKVDATVESVVETTVEETSVVTELAETLAGE